MSGISRMIAKQLSASLGITDEARPALRMTDQPPKVSYDIFARASGETVAEFYSPSVEVLNEIDIPKKGLLGRDAIIALDKAPDTRVSEIETIIPIIDANKRYTREELMDVLENNAFRVKALRNPDDYGTPPEGANYPVYEHYYTQRQDEMILQPEFEEMDYQETIITASRPTDQSKSYFGMFESSGGQHFTEDTLGHFRHSIQKDTRTFEPLYLIEEIQSDLIATGPVRPRAFKGDYIETFKSDIEKTIDAAGRQYFTENKNFYNTNKEFFLDYAAAYAESAKPLFLNEESALEGALDRLNKKYGLNIRKIKSEDMKVPTVEDLPRVSYKGTTEALEEARRILGDSEITGEELVNKLIVYDEADWTDVPENYNKLINYLLDDEGADLYKALNYEKDFYQISKDYNLRAIAKPSAFNAERDASAKLRYELNNAADQYLANRATDVVKPDLFKRNTIPNTLRFIQSIALERSGLSKKDLSRNVAPAPVKKLEEITKLVLQTAIKDAAANGVKKIAIPNVERIAALREKVGSPEYKNMVKKGSSFYKVYDKGVKKALEDIKKAMPEIKVYKDELPYGVTEAAKKETGFDVEYKGDAISLVKARRILEQVEPGSSIGQNQRPISGKALIENILKYNNADWDIIPRPYQELLERLDYEDGLQEGLGLPRGEGGLIRMADDYNATVKKPGYESLPKDATFIDITPYINKDYVLRFNKGGLVERPTK